MTIPMNVVKLVNKHLAKVLYKDKDELKYLLTDKGFFEGSKVDLTSLDISNKNINVSKVINQLVRVQFLHIDITDEKITSIQLSNRAVLKLSSIENLVNPKDIKEYIYKIVNIQAFMIRSQLNVDLRKLVNEYLPEGYVIENWKPNARPDIRQQYVIHRSNVTSAKFFKDLEIIYPIASCFGKVIDDDINISIEHDTNIDEALYPIRQYKLLVDCRGASYLDNFNDPNFSGPTLERLRLELDNLGSDEEEF